MGAASGAGSATGGSGSNTASGAGTTTGNIPSVATSSLGSMFGGFRPSVRTTPQGDRFGNQGQFGAGDVRQFVRESMGNYDLMQQRMAESGVSQADLPRALGVPQGSVYSYMNRPDYQQYGPSGQFYQSIFRPQYSPYQPNPMAFGGYSPFGNYGGGYGGGYGGMGGGYGNPFGYTYATGGEIEQGTSDENETDDQGIAGLLNR